MFLPIGDDQDHERTPFVNYALLGLNGVAFLLLCLPEPRGWVLDELAFRGGSLRPVSLLAHMFLHANLFHIVGNLLFLWIFGRLVEERLGHVGFLAFYLTCGVAAALFHSVATDMPDIPVLGSSGAVSGTIGACLIFCPRARVKLFVWLYFFMDTYLVPVSFWALLWVIEQVYFASQGFQGVAYAAHVGGFGAGVVIAWTVRLVVSALRGRREPPLEPRDAASLAEPRRAFAGVDDGGDLAMLDDAIDAYAVVTLEDVAADAPRVADIAAPLAARTPEELAARLSSTRGVVARRLPRAEAEAIRRELTARGVSAALLADQPVNHPPVPTWIESASWDNRVIRLRSGNAIVPVLWSTPFLVVAARVGEESFIDFYLSRKSAYRIRKALDVYLTRVDARHRSEQKADLAGLARELMRARGDRWSDQGLRELAAGGGDRMPAFADPVAFEDYLFRIYHLAREGHPVRQA